MEVSGGKGAVRLRPWRSCFATGSRRPTDCSTTGIPSLVEEIEIARGPLASLPALLSFLFARSGC